jgi:hypothetical protein
VSPGRHPRLKWGMGSISAGLNRVFGHPQRTILGEFAQMCESKPKRNFRDEGALTAGCHACTPGKRRALIPKLQEYGGLLCQGMGQGILAWGR